MPTPASWHIEAANILRRERSMSTPKPGSKADIHDSISPAGRASADAALRSALDALDALARATGVWLQNRSNRRVVQDALTVAWAVLAAEPESQPNPARTVDRIFRDLQEPSDVVDLPAAQGRALTVDAAAASLPDNPELDAIRRRVERYAQRFRTGQSSECARDREALLRLVDGLRIVARLAADSGVPAEPRLPVEPPCKSGCCNHGERPHIHASLYAEAGKVAPPAAEGES